MNECLHKYTFEFPPTPSSVMYPPGYVNSILNLL